MEYLCCNCGSANHEIRKCPEVPNADQSREIQKVLRTNSEDKTKKVSKVEIQLGRALQRMALGPELLRTKKLRKGANKDKKFGKCKFQFACHYQICLFTHTREEKQFFIIQPDAERRRMYKTRRCYHHQNEKCKFEAKSYFCFYAHNLEESRCVACKQHGDHWMDECSYLRRKV